MYASVDYVLTADVEDLVLVGGAGNIAGAGNALDNTITGNAGDNLINGGAGDDTMIGGDGDDTYVVNSVDDMVIDTLGHRHGPFVDRLHAGGRYRERPAARVPGPGSGRQHRHQPADR